MWQDKYMPKFLKTHRKINVLYSFFQSRKVQTAYQNDFVGLWLWSCALSCRFRKPYRGQRSCRETTKSFFGLLKGVGGGRVWGAILDLCWGILGPGWAQDGSSWAHFGPCSHVLEPCGRLLEGILKPMPGSAALTWSIRVARWPCGQNFKNTSKTQCFLAIFWRQEGRGGMPKCVCGALVVVIRFFLQVSGAVSRSTGLPRAHIIPFGLVLSLCMQVWDGEFGEKLFSAWCCFPPGWACWGHVHAVWGQLGRILTRLMVLAGRGNVDISTNIQTYGHTDIRRKQ